MSHLPRLLNPSSSHKINLRSLYRVFVPLLLFIISLGQVKRSREKYNITNVLIIIGNNQTQFFEISPQI